MEELSRKRRRLCGMRVPHEKLLAIAEVVTGESSAIGSRHALRRTLDALWRDVEQIETVGRFKWYTTSLPKLLSKMVAVCSDFQRALRDLFLLRPCTVEEPYSLIVYADEVVPGNVLRLENRRKMLCLYVCIRDLGTNFIKNELCWLPVAVVRASVAKEVPGGYSAFTRCLFRRWLLEDKVAESGIVLDLDIPTHRYARFFSKSQTCRWMGMHIELSGRQRGPRVKCSVCFAAMLSLRLLWSPRTLCTWHVATPTSLIWLQVNKYGRRLTH